MISITSLLCIFVVAGSVIMTTGSHIVNDGWIYAGNGLRYRMYPYKSSWQAARRWCQQQGGDLAAKGMRDYWTRVYIANVMLLRDEFIWIGLNDIDREGRYMWVDGQQATYSNANWYGSEPNNYDNEDCGGIDVSRNFRTNDESCCNHHYGLCEDEVDD